MTLLFQDQDQKIAAFGSSYKLVQLQLEYAPSAVVDEARLRAAPSIKLRTEITERAAAKLNLR
ncbi:hypothetical protein [Pseudomonas fluorescens]|uniref:hypothetical protein n=1 Tax=Pseudomonas fluorescens TaxID=294 RepID=UPI003B02C389